jgi:poly(3-hydroxybutyrate) depolymerase
MLGNAVRALGLVVVVATARASVAADDGDVVVRKWLVLAAVDANARRTLKPDAVFAKHLLDRASPAPKEGEEIVGTLGKPAKWATREADEKGDVAADGIGWAYASVESAEDRVAIAKLEGAAVLFVGGAGFTGDVYRLGDAGVPVALKKGANDVFVAGTRGAFRLTLREPDPDEHGLVEDGSRKVSPSLHGTYQDGPTSNRFVNATNAAVGTDGRSAFVPLGVRMVSGRLVCAKGAPDEMTPYRRTFVSDIDGSVQSYALVPPVGGASKDAPLGLVLSLHGAGVECMDQAKAYAPKPDFWIVCPTNRGRFGFDWQDWGRLDAYEVLADALKVTGVDPRRVYLTGHSMGGHGTWHLAANDPGRFLAIAPSAGWSSFESYAPQSQVMSPLAWMWRAADGASRTLDLVGNLAQVPTYVLHGEKDDNVPPSEARRLLDALTKAGGKPLSHFEPDAGHWWDKDEKSPGADCVDWAGIWELFRKTAPSDEDVRGQSVTAMDPSAPSDFGWARFEQPIEYGRPCRVVATFDPESNVVTASTENVRLVWLTPPQKPFARPLRKYVVDGRTVPDDPTGFLMRSSTGSWTAAADIDGQKRPGVCGPFKRAFTNRFVLVYGTAGDDAETRELLEKARYDSEVWAYRANGDANLMSDAQFLAGDFTDRNVIVYGNADTNRAWSAVFDDDCPIKASRGAMTVDGAKHEGVVAAAFVRPRKGSDVALAAAFADTGAAATRLFYQFPVFVSGVGIPDYVVFGPGFLREWDGDVRAAGWFDYAWRMR